MLILLDNIMDFMERDSRVSRVAEWPDLCRKDQQIRFISWRGK